VSDRDLILTRVRAASGDVPDSEQSSWDPATDEDPAAAYQRRRESDPADLREEFIRHCRDYRAGVTACAPGDQAIREVIDEICATRTVASLAIPADLPAGWIPSITPVRADEPALSVAELDSCDGVLTGCAVAIASTGTIVLDAGAAQGRRVLTLVPDLHICVVGAEQIHGGVPEAIEALHQAAGAGAPLTFISGPSATSDIELRRIEGVHGPRRLELIVVDPLC
jgi:L-lactate dehydrogenase complex protein LldG